MGNRVTDYFDLLRLLNFNSEQKLFFQFIFDNLKRVEMSDYIGEFNKLGIEFHKLHMMNLEPKQCYVNAANVCIYGNMLRKEIYTEIRYCEGYVTTGNLVIEHAWNCVRNIFTEERIYLDITFQHILNYPLQKINEEDYCVVHEYSLEDLNKLRLLTMCAGPYLLEIFSHQK